MTERADPGPSVIEVVRTDGRLRTRLRTGLLRPQPLHGPPDRCRIGLLATTALLLGGDTVELEIGVGAGVTLELYDVAGTVAQHGRGRAASWEVRLRVADGGRVWWSGQPFVVADGADVTRRLHLELDDGAGALVRETLVLGRAGQVGGRLRNSSRVQLAGRPVLIEDQLLDPADYRRAPGLLGDFRVVDSVLAVGLPWAAPPSGSNVNGSTTTSRLVEPECLLTRHLGLGSAASPLHRLWPASRLPERDSTPGR